jgi:hypothetical protein
MESDQESANVGSHAVERQAAHEEVMNNPQSLEIEEVEPDDENVSECF